MHGISEHESFCLSQTTYFDVEVFSLQSLYRNYQNRRIILFFPLKCSFLVLKPLHHQKTLLKQRQTRFSARLTMVLRTRVRFMFISQKMVLNVSAIWHIYETYLRGKKNRWMKPEIKVRPSHVVWWRNISQKGWHAVDVGLDGVKDHISQDSTPSQLIKKSATELRKPCFSLVLSGSLFVVVFF